MNTFQCGNERWTKSQKHWSNNKQTRHNNEFMPKFRVRNNQDAVSRVRLTKEKRAKEPIPESESLKNFANPYQIKTQIYRPTLLISLIAMRPNFHFLIFLLAAINVSINFWWSYPLFLCHTLFTRLTYLFWHFVTKKKIQYITRKFGICELFLTGFHDLTSIF